MTASWSAAAAPRSARAGRDRGHQREGPVAGCPLAADPGRHQPAFPAESRRTSRWCRATPRPCQTSTARCLMAPPMGAGEQADELRDTASYRSEIDGIPDRPAHVQSTLRSVRPCLARSSALLTSAALVWEVSDEPDDRLPRGRAGCTRPDQALPTAFTAVVTMVVIAALAGRLTSWPHENLKLPGWVAGPGEKLLHVEGRLPDRPGGDARPGSGGDDRGGEDRGNRERRPGQRGRGRKPCT